MSTQTSERTEPLSQRERELLNRLLSDPTMYPQPLKTWLISWLEGSDLTIPASNVLGLASRLDALEKRIAVLEAAP